MYYSGKVNTKAGKQFIRLEQPDRYHKIQEKEKKKPNAWTTLIDVLAILLMVAVAIFMWSITP